jgi:hypothetical protein
MSYTFVIKSQDKISGANNSGSYNINFRILPDDIQFYNATFVFLSSGGFYKDSINVGNSFTNNNSCGYITTNLLNSRSMSSNGSPTNILGTIIRQVDANGFATGTGHPYTTFLSNCYNTIFPKVILKPQIETIQISVYNAFNNTLFVDTDYQGNLAADMTSWILTITLEPIKEPVPST